MDTRFLEAWICRNDHRCFGRRLYPFSAYHLLYLYALESPFAELIRGSEEPESFKFEPGELVQAVWICSQPAGSPLERIVPDRLRSWFRLKIFTWGLWRFDLNGEFKKFYQYLCDFITVPEVWEADEGERKTLSAPWLLSRVTVLSAETAKDEAAIWAMPLGKLLWYSLCLAEMQGLVELISEDEQAMIEELEKQRSSENSLANAKASNGGKAPPSRNLES